MKTPPQMIKQCYQSDYITSQGALNCSISVVHNHLYKKINKLRLHVKNENKYWDNNFFIFYILFFIS